MIIHTYNMQYTMPEKGQLTNRFAKKKKTILKFESAPLPFSRIYCDLYTCISQI